MTKLKLFDLLEFEEGTETLNLQSSIFYYLNVNLKFIDVETCTFEFYLKYGKRYVANLANFLMLVNDENKVTVAEKLANILYNKFGKKWSKISEALVKEYDMLKPYEMISDENYDVDTTDTYENKNKRRTFQGTENEVTGSNSTSNSKALSANNKTHREMKGNIGNKSNQDLILEELELRKHNLLNIIYDDMKDLLTLKIYGR